MLSDGDPDIMPSGRLPLAVRMARRGSSVFDPEILEQLLVDELGAHHFDELQLPFACVATSVRDADERWFEDGPLVPALMASAALPAVFPPVEIGGELFIDGGVVREAPVVQAADMGADVIYLLHVGHLTSVRPPRFERPIDVALHAYWMARLRRFEEDLEELGQRCTLIRLPSGSAPGVRFDDFSQGRALADRAHVATRHFLDTGETLEPVDIGTLEE
jgi:NTE family protein